jgi:hypothetical protein
MYCRLARETIGSERTILRRQPQRRCCHARGEHEGGIVRSSCQRGHGVDWLQALS